MRNAGTIGFAALALACLHAAATAQVSPFGGQFAIFEDKANRDPYNNFAKCIVAKYPSQAQAAIKENGDIIADHRYTQLLDTHCLKRSISFDFIPIQKGHDILFSSVYMKYRMAQAFVQKDYTAGKLPDISHSAPLAHDERRRIDVLEHYAECVSRASPQQVYALIGANADTPEEPPLFAALQPAIKSCSTEDSFENVPVFIWRGALAKELYLLLDEVKAVSQQERLHA